MADQFRDGLNLFGTLDLIRSYSNLMKRKIFVQEKRKQCEMFKQILQLVKIILVMPIHTAECERGFSLMGNIKNDLRARLKSETVTNLMAIKLSQYTIETYNPADAIFQWMESGKRSRRPSTMPYGPRKKHKISGSESNDENDDSNGDGDSDGDADLFTV